MHVGNHRERKEELVKYIRKMQRQAGFRFLLDFFQVQVPEE